VRELEDVIERTGCFIREWNNRSEAFPLEPTTSFVPPSVSEEAEKEKILSVLKQSRGTGRGQLNFWALNELPSFTKSKNTSSK
jgi:hypothetical protein